MLPAEQEAAEVERRNRFDLAAQSPHREAMNPRQHPAVAPLHLPVCETRRETATQNLPFRFELSEGTSNKFWEIAVEGSSTTVRFGRLGTDGQVQTKDHGAPDKARAAAEKLVAEKTKKGYLEKTP